MRSFPGRGLACVLVIVGLLLLPVGDKSARAEQGATTLAIGASVLGVIGTTAIVYGLWRNRPSQQGKKEPGLFPGEFYVGGYLGGSLVQNTDLQYLSGIAQVGGGRLNTSRQKFDPAVVGGLKIGYFLQSIRYLGFEIETNYSRSAISNQVITLSRPVNGSARAIAPDDRWVNWTMAMHIVGRYGFLPDQEVPFGRLQPYVGIGPGLVVLYDDVDAAKNFSLDLMAGVRYMMLKNVSAFVEYKFSQQWDVELESHSFLAADGTLQRGTATFDYTTHRFVLGVAYHF